jgi:hypothetical protein
MSGLTSKPAVFTDFVWTRMRPSGVADSSAFVVNGMSIALSRTPFSLRRPSSVEISSFLIGGLSPAKT